MSAHPLPGDPNFFGAVKPIYDKLILGFVEDLIFVKAEDIGTNFDADSDGNALVDVRGVQKKIFAGKIVVRLIGSNQVREATMTQSIAGEESAVMEIPIPGKSFVWLGFDIYNRAVVVRTFIKGSGTQTGEGLFVVDHRMAELDPGDVMIRSAAKSSIILGIDGKTTFRLDDTKLDSDPTNLVIEIDENRNVTIKNAATIQTNAEKIEDKSPDILLGDDATVKDQSPIVRDTDKGQHIDPVLGIPVTTFQYLTSSTTTKSK